MQKSNTNRWSKQLMKMVALGLLAFVLVACGGNDEQTTNEAELTQEEHIEAEVEKRMAEEESKEEYNSKAHREQMEGTDDDLVSEVKDLLEKSFDGIGDVEYNEFDKLFHIIPTDPRFMDEILGVYDGSLPEDLWYDVVDTYIDLSASIQGVLGDDYGIVLMNPDNLDNMLLWAQNGTLVYEMLELDEKEDISDSEGLHDL